MNETATEASKLWGIYHIDREYARVHGDPLRVMIEAPSKIAAEKQAACLGFGDAWAHPVTEEEARHAQWLPVRRRYVRNVINRHGRRRIDI